MDYNDNFTCTLNCTGDYKPETGNASMTAEVGTGLEAKLVPAAFVVIFVVGIIGNSSLLHYIRGKRVCTPHNIYVINLSIGDIIMLSVSMPFVSTFYIFMEWPYGEFICKLSEFVQTLCAAVTIFTIAALSVERYLIYSAYSQKKTRAFVVIFLIWIIAIMLALPDIVSANILTVGDSEYCLTYRPEWGETYKQVLTIIKVLLLFVVPLMMIITFYLLIAMKLLKQPKLIEQNRESEREPISASGAQMSYSAADDVRRRKLMTLIVFCLVFAFIFCWLPRHFYLIWYHFLPGDFNLFWHVFKTTGFCLMFSNSSINPLLFLIIDRRFRSHMFSCKCCVRKTYSPESFEQTTFTEKQTIVMTDMTCNRHSTVL